MRSRESIRTRPYVLPVPCRSEDDDLRFHHQDLGRLSPLEMWAENVAASAALAALVRGRSDPIIVCGPGWTLSAQWWLRERVQRTKDGRM